MALDDLVFLLPILVSAHWLILLIIRIPHGKSSKIHVVTFKILSEMSKCFISNVLLPIMKRKLKTYYTRFLFSPQCNKNLKSCWHSMWCMWYACVFIWQYCTSFKWQNYSKYKDESCSASCHHNYPDRYIVAIRLYKKLHRLIPEPKLASSGLGNYSTN